MREVSTGCFSTDSGKPGNRSKQQKAGVARKRRAATDKVNGNLLKLRAVLLLLAAPRGAKRAMAANLSRKLNTSPRTLYHWQARFLCDGLVGIERRRRSDSGFCRLDERSIEAIIAFAANRGHGSIRGEYSRLRLPICYEAFRLWVRKVQAGAVITRSWRGRPNGLLF